MNKKSAGDSLKHKQISFRPLAESDFELLHKWLNQPHVIKWWDRDCATVQKVRDKYLPRIVGRLPVECYIMQVDSQPFGYIQTYWLRDYPQYSSQLKVPVGDTTASLDLFIGEQDYLGRGLGGRAIKEFLAKIVFGEMKADECLLGPSQSNDVAIKAYLSAGFKSVHTVSIMGEGEPEHLMRVTPQDI